MNFEYHYEDENDLHPWIVALIHGLEEMTETKIPYQWEPLQCTFTFKTGTQLAPFTSLRQMYEHLLFIMEGLRREQQMTPEERIREQWAILLEWSPTERQAAHDAILHSNTTVIAQLNGKLEKDLIVRRIRQLHTDLGI